jgi:hypothetical protein
MKLHMVLDMVTGQSKARGRSGRWYTQDQINQAYDPADPEGVIFKADLDRSDLNDADLRQLMLDEMHDCPECRAARAAGEVPTFGTGDELLALAQLMARPKPKPKPKQRRWRQQRRRA